MISLVKEEPDSRVIEILEELLEQARRGEINDLVVVASVKDADGPYFYSFSEFKDRWRILGALEYAKSGVNMG